MSNKKQSALDIFYNSLNHYDKQVYELNYLQAKEMENKKEPLMSAEELLINYHNNSSNDWLFQNREVVSKLMNEYSNYVTQWHLNNAKEFMADGIEFIPEYVNKIDKQSIHTAIDNYIKDNL
jgi:hypothetical protein